MRRLVFLLLIAAFALPASAQVVEQERAEQRLRELQQQIEQFERQLSTARQQETDAAQALTGIDREITVREALVETYGDRLTELQRETVALEQEMEDTAAELREMRNEYAVYARQAYVQGRVGDLALILSAGSINQMLVRARYLQRFSRHRERKAAEILTVQDALTARRVQLDSTTAEVVALIAESQREQQQLASRQRDRADLVAQARQRRTTLQSEVRRRQSEAEQLQGRISRLIAEAEAERRRAAEAERRRAAEEAERLAAAERLREERARAERANPRSTTPGATTPPPAPAPAPAPRPAPPVSSVSEAEFERLAGDFRQNRGRLPWPASGVVTENYGPRRNPVTGTTIMNVGLVLSTTPQAPARAVFGGQVSRIFVMPGYGTCVMVSHGSYFTVYGNLSSVSVEAGQRIDAGATVGRAGTGDEPLGAGLFFGVFDQAGQSVDPAQWLSRR